MTRPNTITIVTVLALLFGLCASLLAYNYLKKQTGRNVQGIPVVSAKADLPIGTKLDATNTKLTQWPKDALPPGYSTDPNAFLGRTVVRPLSAGDTITEAKLMPVNVSGGLMTYMVPQGHRAVTVAVNEVAGVAGFITPGSRVDVVLTTPRPGAKDDRDNISKIILQNVPVLASGDQTEGNKGKSGTPPTVTLDLVPEEAERLLVGVKKGTLQLLLRNMIDVASVQTSGATVSKALGAGEVQLAAVSVSRPARRSPPPVRAAAPAAPARFTMEVINGARKSTREFSP